MAKTVILSSARTPIGKMGGGLSTLDATELGGIAIAAALERADVAPEQVEHVVMGQVLQAGQGQIPSRQAQIKAGIPNEVSSETINKVCASGLRASVLLDQAIRAGDVEVGVGGGMESMSRAPYLLEDQRFGARMGDRAAIDSMIRDGLCCPVDGVHMGVHGSEVAAELGVSREQQDAWAARSQQRYQEALAAGLFAGEVMGVAVNGGMVDADEQPRPGTTADRLAELRPAFAADGTITAGNAPGVNDGASAVLLMEAGRARAAGLEPLAHIVAGADSAAEHPYLATVPAMAIEAVLRKAPERVGVGDLKLLEINEAFAAVAITSTRMLEADEEIVNVNGGAIAVGHPIGASGARILMTLVYELRRRGGGWGAAGICSGLAQGEATLVHAG